MTLYWSTKRYIFLSTLWINIERIQRNYSVNVYLIFIICNHFFIMTIRKWNSNSWVFYCDSYPNVTHCYLEEHSYSWCSIIYLVLSVFAFLHMYFGFSLLFTSVSCRVSSGGPICIWYLTKTEVSFNHMWIDQTLVVFPTL